MWTEKAQTPRKKMMEKRTWNGRMLTWIHMKSFNPHIQVVMIVSWKKKIIEILRRKKKINLDERALDLKNDRTKRMENKSFEKPLHKEKTKTTGLNLF